MKFDVVQKLFDSGFLLTKIESRFSEKKIDHVLKMGQKL